MNCKDASELVSQSLDRRLSWRVRLLLRCHLFACDACSRLLGQLRFLRRALRRLPNELAPESEWRLSLPVRERLRKAMEERD